MYVVNTTVLASSQCHLYVYLYAANLIYICTSTNGSSSIQCISICNTWVYVNALLLCNTCVYVKALLSCPNPLTLTFGSGINSLQKALWKIFACVLRYRPLSYVFPFPFCFRVLLRIGACVQRSRPLNYEPLSLCICFEARAAGIDVCLWFLCISVLFVCIVVTWQGLRTSSRDTGVTWRGA